MKKTIILITILMVAMLLLTGCAASDHYKNQLENELSGQTGKITIYDAFGNNTLTKDNTKFSIHLFENFANTNTESNGFKSEVLDLTVDSHQMLHVGSTLIFAEEGLEAIEDYDFEYLKKMTGENKPTFIPLERNINYFQNKFTGKSKVVVAKSQLGITIGIYEGEKVTVSVPEDVPKTTLVTIDGKALYIYRGDYDIMDTEILK